MWLWTLLAKKRVKYKSKKNEKVKKSKSKSKKIEQGRVKPTPVLGEKEKKIEQAKVEVAKVETTNMDVGGDEKVVDDGKETENVNAGNGRDENQLHTPPSSSPPSRSSSPTTKRTGSRTPNHSDLSSIYTMILSTEPRPESIKESKYSPPSPAKTLETVTTLDELSGDTANNSFEEEEQELHGDEEGNNNYDEYYDTESDSDNDYDYNDNEDVLSVTASLLEDYVTLDRKASLRRPSTSSAYEPRPSYLVRPRGSVPELELAYNDQINGREKAKGLAVCTNVGGNSRGESGLRSAPAGGMGRVFSYCAGDANQWGSLSADFMQEFGVIPNARQSTITDASANYDSPTTLSIQTRTLLDEILFLAATLMSSLPNNSNTTESVPHRPFSLTRQPSLTSRIPKTPAYFHTLARYRLLKSHLTKIHGKVSELPPQEKDEFWIELGVWREMFEEVVLGGVGFGRLVGRWFEGQV